MDTARLTTEVMELNQKTATHQEDIKTLYKVTRNIEVLSRAVQELALSVKEIAVTQKYQQESLGTVLELPKVLATLQAVQEAQERRLTELEVNEQASTRALKTAIVTMITGVVGSIVLNFVL